MGAHTSASEPSLGSPKGSASSVRAAPFAHAPEPIVQSARSTTPFDPRRCLPWGKPRKSHQDAAPVDADDTAVDAPDWVPRDAWCDLDHGTAKAAASASPSASTPSTASPPIESYDVSSSRTSFSSFGSRPTTSSSAAGQDVQDIALAEARQRAKMSLETLQLQLKGFGDAVAVRYASWPSGCSVRVAMEIRDGDENDADSKEPSSISGKFVSYDAASRAIEVLLRDGTSRTVPARRVTRSYGGRSGGSSSKHGDSGPNSRSKYVTSGGASSSSSTTLKPLVRRSVESRASHADGLRAAATPLELDRCSVDTESPQDQHRSNGDHRIDVAATPERKKHSEARPQMFGRPQMNPELLV